MMSLKRTFFSRTVSVTAAAVMGCSSLIGAMPPFSVSAEEAEICLEEESNGELVSVIVKVSGDAVLATPEGVEQGEDFIDTDEAAEISSRLESTQEYVQRMIRRFYPELEVKYSYTVLYNGFSCEIPKNLLEKVRELPYVEDVSEVRGFSVPSMANALEMGGIPSYYDTSGCTGEGQVVAVLDSELELDHPMFAPLDDSVKVSLTKEDIKNVAEGIGFNVDIDPERAYRSSKVPYAIDYIEEDRYSAVSNSEEHPAAYHGSHVSGIAVGNKITNEYGQQISGVAKDSQLVFMAVATPKGLIHPDTAIAAFEDAVKLHADVINMSFSVSGEDFGDIVYAEVYNTAENAGITICSAQGNEDNGTNRYNEFHTPQNPDTGTGNIRTYTGAPLLSVASAENITANYYHSFNLNGDRIIFMGYVRSYEDIKLRYFDDTLSGEYAYEYCGTGSEEELEGKDLTGKAALIDYGDYDILDVIDRIKSRGAVCIILSAPDGWGTANLIIDTDLPFGMISYEDRQKMVATETKKIEFDHKPTEIINPSRVSDYSSWGPKQSLELRPDIMGVGGHVLSAYYEGKTEYMSGTSMATPYVAGCSAVLNQYLENSGCELTGGDKLRYMRNLLMTSAIPYIENDMFVSPRRQGSGLVSMKNLISDKVLLTGKEGESKIQLYDNLTDNISFELNMNNISSEDVDFTSARIELTTDSYIVESDGSERISGQQSLSCTASLDQLLHVGAGEKLTKTVTVSLDSRQTSEIKKTFTNGFFVEGYLVLEGADNCCDISVPVFGFYGDWAAVPILDDSCTSVIMGLGDKIAYDAGYSLAELSVLMDGVFPLIPTESYNDMSISMRQLFEMYATDKQKKKFNDLRTENYYFSPNEDGLADNIGMQLMNTRYCQFNGIALFDEDGTFLLDGNKYYVNSRYDPLAAETRQIASMAEGNYIGRVYANVNYESSYDKPQEYEFNFTVDTTAPDVDYKLTERNGKKILRITATDKTLDGVYIIGKKANLEPDRTVVSKILLAQQVTQKYVEFSSRNVDLSDRNLLEKLIIGLDASEERKNINVADVFVAKPDKNGTYTLEYDVTDMESYTVYTLEKAYNMTLADEAEIEDISDRSKAEAVKKLINDLPEDVKLSDKANIEKARKEYDKLTDAQKKYIDEDTLKKLTDAEEALAKAEADKAAADKVIKLIRKIGIVLPNEESLEAIKTAREAYDALTDEQKALVTNYTKLTTAEQTYEKLMAASYKATLTNVSSDKAGTLTVEWDNEGNADGYELLVWSSRRRGRPTEVFKLTVSGEESTAVIEDLAPYNRYYVKVRAYKDINGTRIYGKYSASSSALIKGLPCFFIPIYYGYPYYYYDGRPHLAPNYPVMPGTPVRC